MSFSWMAFYREVAQETLKYEDNQAALLTLLREMRSGGLPTISLEDNTKGGDPLSEIDPFTFLANFSRTGDEQATRLCAWLKQKWNLTEAPPLNFDGRASVEAQNSWFFASTAKGRTTEDIPLLWQLARQCFDGKILDLDEKLFARCLQIKNVAIKKLTTGLFWFSPKGFLPLVGPVIPYLQEHGVVFDPKKLALGDLNEYRQLMESAHRISFDNVALSHEAWKWGQLKPPPPSPPGREFSLNQILYGPPGTGKTFNSINRAVEIIDGFVPQDRDECKARFDELRALGQIEFVTFHQSFSYEEFIEGLRPVLDDESEGVARYENRDGVLKELALKAVGSSLEKVALDRVSFEQVWEAFLQEINEEGERTYAGLTKGTEWKIEESAHGIQARNIRGVDPSDFSSCRKSDVQRIWAEFSEKDSLTTAEVKVVLGRRRRLIVAVFNQLKRLEKTLVPTTQNLENGRDAAQSYLNGSPDYRTIFHNAPRFVLIVDEINRGNISKILGELITLLEDDKRIGKPNELRIKLPVSQDSFALPPNLYVLGTMNTADKSLALLDIALRRRFSFVEMPPRADLYPDFARETLKTLNLRLEAALDREHRLGHAYFIGCADVEAFDRTFRDKIIPLLQEFFYNDWESLRAVLGEGGNGTFIKALPELKGIKTRTKWRWWFDVDGSEELSSLAALKANYARLATGDGETP